MQGYEVLDIAGASDPNLISGNMFINTGRWMKAIGNVANIIDEPLRAFGNAA